jgi:hypothetical protein
LNRVRFRAKHAELHNEIAPLLATVAEAQAQAQAEVQADMVVTWLPANKQAKKGDTYLDARTFLFV